MNGQIELAPAFDLRRFRVGGLDMSGVIGGAWTSRPPWACGLRRVLLWRCARSGQRVGQVYPLQRSHPGRHSRASWRIMAHLWGRWRSCSLSALHAVRRQACNNNIVTITTGTVHFMWKLANVLPMTAEQKRTLEAWNRARTTPRGYCGRGSVCWPGREDPITPLPINWIPRVRPFCFGGNVSRKQALRVCLRTPHMV